MANKTAVIYKSTYGSTEKYARWIAESLNADIFPCGKVKPKSLNNYETIIFAGSLHAIGIKGINLITKHLDKLGGKKLIVISVGCSPSNEENLQRIEARNFPGTIKERIKHFYFRGAFNYSKLNFIDKTMMNMIRNMLSHKKEPLTDDEKDLLACYETPIDWTDKSLIEPLIEYAKN
jgi:menaquinone-dependent protoporphyrinogen IX oxidase